MAAAEVFAPNFGRKPSMGWTATPIIVEPMVQPAAQQVLARESFSPEKHLQYTPPAKVHSMEELGFADRHGVSPVAVSEPFPLFTQEAVMRFREEVLSKEVVENCSVSSNLSHCQLRGFASKYAPFVYDTWKNPEVLQLISSIAGIDLVPAMDFEIAHINLSVQTQEQVDEELRAYREEEEDDDKDAIVGWHTDSYPFVCVTMLSDCSQMIGGETALRTGTGEIMKVRGPQMGCAVVLQGRYIEHQALRALGGTERITMVTSFRPKNPHIRDDTVLTTVRPISDLKELYSQFSEYRLEILEERIRAELKAIREARAAGRGFSTRKLKAFLGEQQKFLEHMNCEMVDEEMVTTGMIDDSHLLTKKNDARPVKRPRPGNEL